MEITKELNLPMNKRFSLNNEEKNKMGDLMGESSPILEIKKMISQVAPTELTVLITGESGTGKDVIARIIHKFSQRSDYAFVKINCAALPENLLEAELFGYEKGAFTGAHEAKPGRFEFARSGTIFLDEIGEMSSFLQAKLLQVIEEKKFMRLGGKKEIEVDVRIVAATNRDIERSLAEGMLRHDLFYRLAEAMISVSPLRERNSDIPLLIHHFLDKYSQHYQAARPVLSPSTLSMVNAYKWPGNVRELENYVKRMVIFGDENVLLAAVGNQRDGIVAEEGDENDLLSLRTIGKKASLKAEREAIITALERSKWNRAQAAKELQISYKTLLSRIKECGF